MILGLLLTLFHCNKPASEIILAGYDQGKRTMKLEYRVFNIKLDNGQRGKRMETLVHYAIGNRISLKTERTAMLHEDFSLYQSQSTKEKNQETSSVTSQVENNKILIDLTGPDGQVRQTTVDHKGPVFIELLPMLYTKDLKNPGGEKSYPVLLEEEGRVAQVKVRFVGPETFYENDKSQTGLHYQIQSLNNPAELQDIFVDAKTRGIMKIQFGKMKFIPPPS